MQYVILLKKKTMNRIIYFLGSEDRYIPRRQFICNYHNETEQEIKDKNKREVYTTNLEFLSFDLLDDFEEVYLYYEGFYYNLKLGSSNSWIDKELRRSHNLLKLVKSNILI